MDQTAPPPPTGVPVANHTKAVQEQQDSLLEQLQKQHTAKRTSLRQEYEDRRAQVDAQLHAEVEDSRWRFKGSLQKIQCALEEIEESVESTTSKRVELHLKKDLLRREYEVRMQKAATDLHEKVLDLITHETFDWNGIQTALLEKASTSPCTADSTNDHHFFESRLELHPTLQPGHGTSPYQSLALGTNNRASTPHSYVFEPTRQAMTAQRSSSQTSIPTADIRSQNYKSMAPAPTQHTLQAKPPDLNPEPSVSTRPPRAQPSSCGPTGYMPQPKPGLPPASERQEAKRKNPESSTIDGPVRARKRQRANNSPAAAANISAAGPTVDEPDYVSQPSNTSQEQITQRVITFEELYQDGKAKNKHKIFRYKESDDWYIVKCDEHNMHFGFDNPVHGAAKHINSPQHGKMPMKHDLAIKVCGFLIKHCTEKLAEKNNNVFAKEIEKGYQVLKPKRLARNSQAKPREVKPPDDTVLPGADNGLNDEGPENLTTGVEPARQPSDCIIIRVAESSEAESATNSDDACGDDGGDVDFSSSVAHYSASVPNRGQISMEKQRADGVASAVALHHYCENDSGLGGEKPRNSVGDVTDRQRIPVNEDPVDNYKRFDALQSQMGSKAGSR